MFGDETRQFVYFRAEFLSVSTICSIGKFGNLKTFKSAFECAEQTVERQFPVRQNQTARLKITERIKIASSVGTVPEFVSKSVG